MKKKYGAGYHLVIVKEASCDVQRITELIRKYIPEVVVNQNVGAELTYLLPGDKSHSFKQVFEELEQNRRSYGISSYGASVTTMEEVYVQSIESIEQRIQQFHFQVFIRVGEKVAEAKEAAASAASPGSISCSKALETKVNLLTSSMQSTTSNSLSKKVGHVRPWGGQGDMPPYFL